MPGVLWTDDAGSEPKNRRLVLRGKSETSACIHYFADSRLYQNWHLCRLCLIEQFQAAPWETVIFQHALLQRKTLPTWLFPELIQCHCWWSLRAKRKKQNWLLTVAKTDFHCLGPYISLAGTSSRWPAAPRKVRLVPMPPQLYLTSALNFLRSKLPRFVVRGGFWFVIP